MAHNNLEYTDYQYLAYVCENATFKVGPAHDIAYKNI